MDTQSIILENPAQMARPKTSLSPKPVRASETTLADLMSPPDANINGTVFGGRILALVDKAAAVCASRHAAKPCATIAMERVEFLVPIQLGDLVVVEARIHHAGRTSMEIGVEVHAESMLGGPRRHANNCLVTMVALDAKGRPSPVPPLSLETRGEKERHAAAVRRREDRLKNR
ncbi:MAG: acyl-CoA thioesterase [Elusimicrobia bacterium CG_4_9_14_3_um_filter_62_55]|nr:MAG: acyl-CoA thioesterase [Elusimicrobia bacterium CG22_combo_CG10-13_8_21_14_all_63_91]PJA14232.1 MAG: acyl-CoA thioesterase [Elusimicrobia bacterium CG_4_10_14_0_2_um_filter_63_34]PJB24611.1 MAG: acyl-CoA thioesterase [Elusimicrobia bacterium CG_4_9_14_3_um_filter_62_55]